MPEVRIGDSVVMGAKAVVTRDVPDYTLLVRNRAKIIASDILVSDKGQIISDE